MALKENFLNDVFEGNRKYRFTQNEDGTYSITDVTEYTQEGDLFGAGDINATNAAVNAHIADTANPHKATAEQVGARPDTWMPTASDVGAVPSGRKVNGKALSADITLSASDVGAAAASHNHAAGDITSGTFPVARGGTGATTFASGAALIGAGTGAVTTRAITNLTAKGAATASTHLATANTVVYDSQARLNRTTLVNAADTGYTTYMARGIALVTAVPTSMTNGTAAFVYS